MIKAAPPEPILKLVRRLGAPCGLERSFRLSSGEVIDRRRLASFAREAVDEGLILSSLDELGFPSGARGDYLSALPRAAFLHFGHEASESGDIFKAYLEFPAEDEGRPALVHLAYKWSPAAPGRFTRSRYVAAPALGIGETIDRFVSILPPGRGRDEARQILLAAARRNPEAELRLLEVTDEGTDRRSYDINLYDAQLTIGSVAPLLRRVGERLGVAQGRLGRRLVRIGSDVVGHLSAGVHRDGGPFLTVHHGVEAYRP